MKLKMSVKKLLFVSLCAWLACTSQAHSASNEFSFGVIANPFKVNAEESMLRNAIHETDAENLAFVVVNGIKSNQEPCSDHVFMQRKGLFESAQNGLILSLATDDWSDCRYADDRSAAVERLNRIRDLFFTDEFSFGASKIPLLRQSSSPKFRSYGENMRWEINSILFATINLPANNNNYHLAAGRNNEFEDRLIANRDWLKMLVTYAKLKKLNGIVLFSDANPFSQPQDSSKNTSNKRDGFIETRRLINSLAAKYTGKILLIHNQQNPDQTRVKPISWRGNLGEFSATSGWTKIRVTPKKPTVFSVKTNPLTAKISRQ